MITEVLDWGLEPQTVTTDAWYSSKKNLKFFKNNDNHHPLFSFFRGIDKIHKILTYHRCTTNHNQGRLILMIQASFGERHLSLPLFQDLNWCINS
jgi:hypothetical protein